MTRAAPDASASHKRKADEFEWETSKENVMPLKRGRNVADLNKALRAHESFQTKLRLEDEVSAKEDAIARYGGDDPVAPWLEYVHWLEVEMPEDTRKKFKVLEKCTRELKDTRKYRNDMRYIRLWIQYADLVSNPKDIFKYLYQNKIGERVSLFYIGWAYVLETMGNYPQAHKIYLKASQKNAEPQDLLERKYTEFQRRMSRQWLRMTQETGTNDIDEVTHRRALESLSANGTLELNDAQREQLHQHQASARAQRVQQVNSHKPVFIIYEDPVGHSVDPFDGNGGWKKLGTMQQQDKENQLTPTAWKPPAPREADAGRQPGRRTLPTLSGQPDANPLQVFVDDEFLPEHEPKRRTPLTHRSQTLRQRMEGVATEEEMLAQEPLKNCTASDKKARLQKRKVETPCYDVKQLTSETGEALSFEEVRARAFKQDVDRRRKLGSRVLQNVRIDINSAYNATSTAAIMSDTASPTEEIRARASKQGIDRLRNLGSRVLQSAPIDSNSASKASSTVVTAPSTEESRARASKQGVDRLRSLGRQVLQSVPIDMKAASNATSTAEISSDTASSTSHEVKPTERQPTTVPATSISAEPSKPVSTHHDDQEDMTINTRVALEDINSMFCSPPRQPKPTVWEVKEDAPVERKLHFSVFDDSVDSVAVNTQDQSLRQDPNESIPKQAFQIFSDDAPNESQTGNRAGGQKRKPLGARDDLVRRGRLTNKDALMQAEKDAATKDSAESLCLSRWIQGATKNLPQVEPPRNVIQSTTLAKPHTNVSAPALELNPFTFENRQAHILDRRVDLYLCSRDDAVKLHSRKLPRLPFNHPTKRKLRKPIVIKASSTLTLQLVGELGSGSYAQVFSADVSDTATSTTGNKAIKFEKERHNLAWEFYITNKIRKKRKIDNRLEQEKIPVPTFSGLSLFPNGALLIMEKGHVGTLFDVLNCYKQEGIAFPEVLAVYYGIKMLRCIELLHDAEVLHGDIKPDNWLMTPGKPSSELAIVNQEPDIKFQAGDLYLIDYGRSIDLTLYPERTVFRGNCHVKGFQSVEMLTQRPWTKQIDTFAFCGTLYCMLFGGYMEVKPRRDSKGVKHWEIVKPFKRYWQVDMWKDIFHALLNVSSCWEQPSLSDLRRRLENYFAADPSRQQELYKQLSRQDRFLRKSTV